MYITNCTVYRLPPNHLKEKSNYERKIAEIQSKIKQGRSVRPSATTDALNEYKRFLIPLGAGTAALKIDAEKRAAVKGIETLRKQNYYRPPPELWAKYVQMAEEQDRSQ